MYKNNCLHSSTASTLPLPPLFHCLHSIHPLLHSSFHTPLPPFHSSTLPLLHCLCHTLPPLFQSSTASTVSTPSELELQLFISIRKIHTHALSGRGITLEHPGSHRSYPMTLELGASTEGSCPVRVDSLGHSPALG